MELNDVDPLLLAVIGIPVVLALPLILSKTVGAWRRMLGTGPASRVVISLGLSLLGCLAIGIVLDGLRPGAQVFEAFGAAKKFGLPLTYLIFALALLAPYAQPQTGRRIPLWWYGGTALLATSTALAVAFPRQRMELLDIAQGAALVGGILLLALMGGSAWQWVEKEKAALMVMLGATGLVAQLAHLPLGPFVAVPVPAAAGLLYLAVRARKGRLLALAAAGLIGWSLFTSLGSNTNASIAVLTQVAVSVALIVLLMTPRTFRIFIAVIGSIAALAGAWKSGLFALMSGDGSGTMDVTLAHRAYEAMVVFDQMAQSPATLLFGLGPAATVNLASSPDVATLAASGRNLLAVDDVHFLTSWVLLKFGLLGIIWLVAIFVAFAVEALHILRQRKPPAFESFLVMFVAAGIVTALPAATHFFANPLPALFLAVLYARRKRGQLEQPTTPAACSARSTPSPAPRQRSLSRQQR